jgi:hypothetical protein
MAMYLPIDFLEMYHMSQYADRGWLCVLAELLIHYLLEWNMVNSDIISRVEAGSNTSTVTLRVVGGNEKGSLESETVKYGHESYGTWTQK